MSLSVPMNDPNGRQYSRDSFDRFGDDLSELLLSYLDFEDKFRFECVSKQWKSLVFNKVLHFDYLKLLSKDWYKYLTTSELWTQTCKHVIIALKKCHNVKTIKLYVNEQTVSSLSLLSDNCPRLKSIESIVTPNVLSEQMTTFGQKYGSKVEVLNIIGDAINKTELLSWYPNLKSLKLWSSGDWLSLVGNGLVPTLNTLKQIWVESHDIPAFIQLVDKYKNSLKNFDFHTYEEENIDLIFQQLYRLKNIESISLDMNIIDHDNELVIDLTPIMNNLNQFCPNLSMIKLNILDIALSRPSKPMMSLKKLSIDCNEVSNDFFLNISDLTPNLKKFSFFSDMTFTNEHFNCLSRLKHIKRLHLESISEATIDSMDDSAIIQLLDNCKQLNKLKLEFPSNITVKTIDKLKEVANNRPKDIITFKAITSDNELITYGQSMSEITTNLLIHFYQIPQIIEIQ